MNTIDLTAACRRTIDVLAQVDDAQLDGVTPCPDYPVRGMVAHVGGLATAFAAAARKDTGELTNTPPASEGSVLDPDWRSAYPERLLALAQAWQRPDAWQGMTQVGGIDLPGEVAGSVALAEVVIHGWDLARATGQPFDCDHASAQACLAHLSQFDAGGTEGLFGPAVPVGAHATALDRIVAISGRDPAWSPD
ncbi:TIGR03086 family metal-binding protein [soil metagenome]